MSASVDNDLLRVGTTDEIAMALLRGFGPQADSLNGWNIINGYSSRLEGQPDKWSLLERVGDAWAWLIAHGCIGISLTQATGGYVRVTDRGEALANDPNALFQLQAEELLSANLAPQLIRSARPAFARGDFEVAAFAAMKAVEVEVRQLSGLDQSFIGTKLMQEAFRAGGPLVDPTAEAGEQVAKMQLFMGAIGSFKNPASHRTVAFEDPHEAAEIIQLANLLLRMLGRSASSHEAAG